MTQESSIPPVAALERNRREILAAIERNSERIAPHPVLCTVTRLSSGESAQMPNEGSAHEATASTSRNFGQTCGCTGPSA
jgi:hypothetical protein